MPSSDAVICHAGRQTNAVSRMILGACTYEEGTGTTTSSGHGLSSTERCLSADAGRLCHTTAETENWKPTIKDR